MNGIYTRGIGKTENVVGIKEGEYEHNDQYLRYHQATWVSQRKPDEEVGS